MKTNNSPFSGVTIAAISTPPGKGGVAVIRISGDEAFTVAQACFSPKSGKALYDCAARYAVYGDILSNGKVIDDGIALLFPAPFSYTGENMAEISCHGGILLARTVLSAVLCAGAVLAKAGEFTRRAFLNGKISLSEAESVALLLEAKTEAQMMLSSRTCGALLGEAAAELTNELLSLLSSIYAAIDYPDEDLAELSNEEIIDRLSEILLKVRALRSTYRTGHAIAEGIPTVICGKPNVGKSSLYNCLCREDCAIVTDEAGTTRDVLERIISTGQVTLRLFDTAGLHTSENAAEKIGIDRAHTAIKQAELVIPVFDGSSPLSDEDKTVLSELSSISAYKLAVINKTDLKNNITAGEIDRVCDDVVFCSAKMGIVTPLLEKIEKLYVDETIIAGESAIVTTARQNAALDRAASLLDAAVSGLRSGSACDVCCSDMELALGALAELDGKSVSEQIVDEIFSHFCIGK